MVLCGITRCRWVSEGCDLGCRASPVRGFRLSAASPFQQTHRFPRAGLACGEVDADAGFQVSPKADRRRARRGGATEIDITTVDQFRPVLLDAADAGPPLIVLDMTRTVFCDASGLHTLLRAHKRAVSRGGELRLVAPGDSAVSRVVRLTCLDHLIPCFCSLAGALAWTPALPRHPSAPV